MSFLGIKEYTNIGPGGSDPIGHGGEAIIYLIRHNTFGYIRALRVYKDSIPRSETTKWEAFEKRCGQLMRLGNGNQPSIVHIYKLDRLEDGRPYIEVDYIKGETLREYLWKKKCLPVDEVLQMVEQISRALAYCHYDAYEFIMNPDADNDILKPDPVDGRKLQILSEGDIEKLVNRHRVVHNDIHSGNIMRRKDGGFVLIDFGLSVEGDEDLGSRSSRLKDGHPEFKAPERWDIDKKELAKPTPQSDVYSFGVVMFEYLTGRPPFPSRKKEGLSSQKDDEQLREAHKNTAVPSIYDLRKRSYEIKYKKTYEKRDYPQWLEKVIYQCLQKDPKERYPDGKALYDDVMGYLKDENPLMIELKGLREQVETLKESVDHLTSKLVKAEDDKVKLREEAEKEKAQLRKEAEEKIAKLRAERDSVEQKLNEAKSIIIKLEERIKELEKRAPITLPPSNSEIAKLKEQLKQANKRIHELEQQLAEKKLPTEEELKRQRNRFLKAAALVLAILLGAGGWFGWNGYKKINYTEQQLETMNDSLIRQERRIRRLQNDNEKQVYKNYFASHSEVEGNFVGFVTNKTGENIFLMEQKDKNSVCHVTAYALGKNDDKYEKVPVFYVPGQDGQKKDRDDIPSKPYKCWHSSCPNDGFFIFNEADNTLFIPLLNKDKNGNYGSDRYIVYEYDGERFKTKTTNDGGFWIHSSLRDYRFLVAVLTAKNRLIRIDEMKDGSYRCAVWNNKVDMTEEPNLVMVGNLIGTEQFLFEDAQYTYYININPEKLELKVSKGKRSQSAEPIEVVVSRDASCWPNK